MRRILPVFARLRSRILGNCSVSDCASQTIELAPAVDRIQAAAISLPDEFDRVIAVQGETTVALERERLSEGKKRHGPTIAYRIDDAVLGEGTLYYGSGYEVMRSNSSSALLPHNSDHFAEMQLCSNYVIERYFGHWLTDGMCMELLAQQRSLPALTLSREPWLHELDYRTLFGLKATFSRNAQVDRLWIIDDRGINDSWISRMQELRRRCRSAVKSQRSHQVLLARGTLGAKRNLVNSVDVQEILDRMGFEIVTPEFETPESIGERLSGAEFAITVEGSAQNHCWDWMPVGSTFIAIQPPDRFNAHGKSRADAIGLNWAYVVAEQHPDGFYLPIDRLLKTIDEAGRVAESRRNSS
jgi:hypothetical protein